MEFHWSSNDHFLHVGLKREKFVLSNDFHRIISSAQTVSLIWHVPFIDRVVFDHKERDFHRVCYRKLNHDNEEYTETVLTGDNADGITDFDLNAYLTEHIPVGHDQSNEQNSGKINAMIGEMNDTDRRILNLMDYYEKQ